MEIFNKYNSIWNSERHPASGRILSKKSESYMKAQDVGGLEPYFAG